MMKIVRTLLVCAIFLSFFSCAKEDISEMAVFVPQDETLELTEEVEILPEARLNINTVTTGFSSEMTIDIIRDQSFSKASNP